MQLSIVVPVYNGENVIRKCLKSLLKQELEDYEIICIDDGSTDGSLKILNREKCKNRKIKVIHQENKGVWFARKRGIKEAKGKWIGFVDCDDTISMKMYKTMIELAQKDKTDMVVCGFNRVNAETDQVYATQMTYFGTQMKDASKDKGFTAIINPSMCNKLFKTEICRQAIELENAPRIMEDLVFTGSILPLVQKISFTDKPLYMYYDQKNSVTKEIGYKDILDAENAMMELKKFYDINDYDKDLVNLLAFIHLGVAMTINYNQHHEKDIIDIWRECRKFLNDNFKYKNRYLNISYIMNHWQMWKVFLTYQMFDNIVYLYLIKLYHVLTTRMNLELKW